MSQHPETIAIIPARGGSKGIPRKNIIPLHGKPLIVYSIEIALQSRSISRVIVSTDDEEIAAISKEHGAEVPFLRPKEIAGDRSPVGEAVKYTLARLRSESPKHEAPIFTTLFPTHPFRTPALIDYLTGKLLAGHKAVFTVKQIRHSSYSLLNQNLDGTMKPLWHNQEQKAPALLSRTYGTFLGNNPRGHKKPFIYVLPDQITQIDIDTFADLSFAEKVIEKGLFDFQGATLSLQNR